MALSAKEREKIVEEETLRYETRRDLHKGRSCTKGSCRRGRCSWLWILAAAILAYAAWSYAFCGRGGRHCPFMGSEGATPMCHHGGMGMDMGQDAPPSQTSPKKP